MRKKVYGMTAADVTKNPVFGEKSLFETNDNVAKRDKNDAIEKNLAIDSMPKPILYGMSNSKWKRGG